MFPNLALSSNDDWQPHFLPASVRTGDNTVSTQLIFTIANVRSGLFKWFDIDAALKLFLKMMLI